MIKDHISPFICSTSFIRMWTHRWYIWAASSTDNRAVMISPFLLPCHTIHFSFFPVSLPHPEFPMPSQRPARRSEQPRPRPAWPRYRNSGTTRKRSGWRRRTQRRRRPRLGPIHHLLIRSRQATVWTTIFSNSLLKKNSSVYPNYHKRLVFKLQL